jgi:PAS domain S-box-containing protein
MDFSLLLKHYRAKKGLTQQEVASLAGLSLRTYQRIESGENEASLSQVYRLCHLLEFNFMEIFRFESNVITEEQRVLRQSIKFLEQVNEVSRVGGWEMDPGSRKITWTDMTRKIMEVPSDYMPEFEVVTNFWKEGLSRETIVKALEKCLKDGTPNDLELEMVTATGKAITVISRMRAETCEGKVHKVFGTVQDVTAIREAERILKETQEEISFLTEDAKIGIWKMEIKQNKISWSKSLYKIFEIKDTEDLTYQNYLSLVHPDDRERMNQVYLESLATRQPYEIIHRIVMPDGRIKVLLGNGQTYYDANGEPYLSRGYATDITKISFKGISIAQS